MIAPSVERPRRVLIVIPQPFYEDRGTPISIRLVARALSELGYRVDVLAFPPGKTVDFPQISIYRTPNPLRIRSVPIGFSWRKLLLDAQLAGALRRMLRVTAYDYVHAVEEAAYLCLLVNRPDLPVIYDMASSIPEQLAAVPPFAGRLQQKFLRRLEHATLNAASYVLCSQGLQEHVQSQQALQRVEAWQYPPSPMASSPEDVERLMTRLRIADHARVVVYAGSFAEYQGLDVLIEAVPLVRRKRSDVVFVLVGGTPPEVAAMRATLDPTTAQSVRLLERQPSGQIGAFLACADLLVSTRRTGANLPIKVFDYLTTGKPILISRCPAHEVVMHHDQVAAFDHNPHSLADLILSTLAERDRKKAGRDQPPIAEDRELREHWDCFKAQIARVYAAAAEKQK